MKADPQRESGSNDGDEGRCHGRRNHQVTNGDRGRDDHDAHGFERILHDPCGHFRVSQRTPFLRERRKREAA